MINPTAALRVYRVSEIRDDVLHRDHGYYASLDGAFAYCETEERKKPLIDGVRFELAPAPGGTQWLIHVLSGPDDTWPETSDLVISQHDVIRDEEPATSAAPLPPANQTADFVPPAADGLPAGTLEAAEIGANRLDAWARTPQGRNFLAHALVQLARTGWLRTEPGEPFQPMRDTQPATPSTTPNP